MNVSRCSSSSLEEAIAFARMGTVLDRLRSPAGGSMSQKPAGHLRLRAGHPASTLLFSVGLGFPSTKRGAQQHPHTARPQEEAGCKGLLGHSSPPGHSLNLLSYTPGSLCPALLKKAPIAAFTALFKTLPSSSSACQMGPQRRSHCYLKHWKPIKQLKWKEIKDCQDLKT